MNASMKVVLAGVLAASLGACASKPAEVAGEKAPEVDRRCLRDTGTKIKDRAGCVNGRVVTAEEIEASGAGTIGEVLTKLPPR
jgi:hypothetical protein